MSEQFFNSYLDHVSLATLVVFIIMKMIAQHITFSKAIKAISVRF